MLFTDEQVAEIQTAARNHAWTRHIEAERRKVWAAAYEAARAEFSSEPDQFGGPPAPYTGSATQREEWGVALSDLPDPQGGPKAI
jgi:hypothetical protein